MIRARSAAAVRHRRRGSVLVLVMTLLGILFVTGVAFLASMNFEAEIVGIERGRARQEGGIETVIDENVSSLRDGLVGDGIAPFGGSLDEAFSPPPGVAAIALGELPGVHDLFAPVEPYVDTASGELRFRSYTYLPIVMGTGNKAFATTLADRRDIGEVDVSWTSGVRIDYIDRNSDPATKYPVDSDGDGVTDTFQFPVSELGFSAAQIAKLSSTLNPPSNPGGDVFLGMRVVAHGGLVNLNESHPTLIGNVLDLPQGYALTDGPVPNVPSFNHRPSTEGVKYSPQLEESVIRRRGLLPPRKIAPSLLHGNALLNQTGNGLEFGLADMPTKLFPADDSGEPVENVFEGNHRYTPFDGLNEKYDENSLLWPVRMEPFTSFNADGTGNAYDRRHLVTTVSHDDLLSRGGRAKVFDVSGNVTGDIDLREAMISVNQAYEDNRNPEEACALPFEYADYPQNMEPGGCECLADQRCRLNARKGRLALSLAWLDTALSSGAISTDQQQRLIHDAFMMLLRNARGAYWEDIPCPNGLTNCAAAGGLCQTPDADPATWQCYDPITGLSPREALISRTAASLTANLIDFMDEDDIPTPVALRSFDFSDLDTVGREIGNTYFPGHPEQIVYGLERQPYITEVTTVAEGDPPRLSGWAVELYNPYDQEIANVSGSDVYYLVPIDSQEEIPPVEDLLSRGFPITTGLTAVGPGAFTVVLNDATKFENITLGDDGRIRENANLEFRSGWILYLVRSVDIAGDPDEKNIVVDQFTVGGPGMLIGQEDSALASVVVPGGMPANVFSFSQMRSVPDESSDPTRSRWSATVPVTTEIQFDHSLGSWNDPPGLAVTPVEVNFANTGGFAGDNAAFPTTGSMLLLMRHANRPLSDRSLAAMERDPGAVAYTESPIEHQTTGLSFTTWLDRETLVDPGSNVFAREREQIDNGRMPVFDPPVRECASSGMRCRSDLDCTAGDTCEQIAPAVHHADPGATAKDTPGGIENLPWGQLLWDYFTVLPLSSAGPYTPPPGVPWSNFTAAAADSIPRVDLDGLRVHGRININAAPWMVMGGLPLVPMDRIPASFRATIGTLRAERRAFAGLDPIPDYEADQLIVDQGMAIAAYREARSIQGSGDYGSGDPTYHRDWELAGPTVRRGTGFLAVGELANVRHPGAVHKLYQMDSGELTATEPDYVKAIALLASLGDWVTVRSHVFTTYGTLRGEGDRVRFPDDGVDKDQRDKDRANDVDKRAVRFQETVDRLPTFLGASKPTRIGQRYVGPYIDVRND